MEAAEIGLKKVITCSNSAVYAVKLWSSSGTFSINSYVYLPFEVFVQRRCQDSICLFQAAIFDLVRTRQSTIYLSECGGFLCDAVQCFFPKDAVVVWDVSNVSLFS